MSGPFRADGHRAASSVLSIAPLGRESADGRQRLFDRISEAEALSHVGRLLLNLSEKPKPAELQSALKQDPALVARLLRRVNSDYYALHCACDSLAAAIELLGVSRVRNLGLTVLVSRRFADPDAMAGHQPQRIWNHLVGVATVADMVSRICGRAEPQTAYLGGLFHDLGLVFLARHLGRHFRCVLREVGRGRPTIEVEQEVYGFDHGQLGHHVGVRWGLPEPLLDVMADHHRPELYGGDYPELVAVVATANYLCSRGGWHSLGYHNIAPPDQATAARLSLDSVTLSILWENLPDALRRAAVLARG